jgi:glycosyltransferase involved in cell wall biosynthesis
MTKPSCSVVLASHELSDAFYDSVQSALTALSSCSEQGECIVVLDGRSEIDRQSVIRHFGFSGDHLKVICVPRGGLTRALIQGCSLASGDYIARLDVGDAMRHDRLARQIDALMDDPHCVLATSYVEYCGPRWEPLWLNRGSNTLVGSPIRVDQIPPIDGLLMDIPHHSSVMFRRDLYLLVGGYRSEFYFGQDWDLWYRLAQVGSFVHLPEPLTRVRLFTDGLSSRHWREQRRIASLSRACYQARSQGEPEDSLLQQASAIRPVPRSKSLFPWDGRRADGAYFIAEALRRNGDQRCHAYFMTALRHGFWKPRIWLRLFQSFALTFRAQSV